MVMNQDQPAQDRIVITTYDYYYIMIDGYHYSRISIRLMYYYIMIDGYHEFLESL